MKLLVTTQAVDRDDPILGFFHEWLVALGGKFESIHVICLRKGVFDLPSNVHVHSLGKERSPNRAMYIVRFFRYAWSLRNEYDAVFSHMNPHYIVLAGLLWKVWGKRMYFWRNHARMTFMTRIAAAFARTVFYTSSHACTRRYAHAVQMPVGINTALFTSEGNETRTHHSVLFLGRLSPVKRPVLFMEAARLLTDARVCVYGDIADDLGYTEDELRALSSGTATFFGSVPNYRTPEIYRSFDVYVNLTPEGSMDKTVLEAAACGAIPLVLNTSYAPFLPPTSMIPEATPEAIARAITDVTHLSASEKDAYRDALRTMVETHHSLALLSERLATILKQP